MKEEAASAAFFMVASRLHALGILCFAWAWLAWDHYRPWINFHSEALALAAVGLLAVSRFMHHRFGVARTPRAVGLVLTVALVPWVQYLLGISLFAGDALIASLYLCGLAAAIWVGFTLAQDFEKNALALTSIFYVLWFAALASAAIGLLQWLNLQAVLAMYVLQADAGDRALSNLGQPNQLATLLLMGMATLAWTFERGRIGEAGLAVGVAFLTMVLALTQSRAGMLSAAAMVTFLTWKLRGGHFRLKPKHAVGWLVAFGLTLWLLPYLQDALLIGGSRSMNPGIDNARLSIWKQVLNGIGHAPWFGYGWNQTPTAHAAGSLAFPGSMTFTHAHNVILDLVAWNGIPLGLLLAGVCVYWFISRSRGETQPTAVYALTCVLPIYIHSLVEFPFAFSYFLVAAGLMAGVVEASRGTVKTFAFKVRWVGLAVAAWFAIGSYIVYEYLLIEEDYRVVRFENLRIGRTATDYQVPHVWMLSHMAAMLKAARQRPARGMDAEELENLRKVSSRFAYGAVRFRYALALGLNGNPSEATSQMAILRGMYGDFYYQAAVGELRALQRDGYPELSQVITP